MISLASCAAFSLTNLAIVVLAIHRVDYHDSVIHLPQRPPVPFPLFADWHRLQQTALVHQTLMDKWFQTFWLSHGKTSLVDCRQTP